LRHALYDWGVFSSQKGALPTLVVGNAELGGTGKTPHVLHIAQRLQRLLGPEAVGILSRGYGRTSNGFVWVSNANSWREVGDEPWWMQGKLPSAHVAVSANRLDGLSRMAQDRPALKAVVLDDGLQHRALKPDLTVGLHGRPTPSVLGSAMAMVPSGPWRDLPSRLRTCDLTIFTGSERVEKTQVGLSTRWVPGQPVCISSNDAYNEALKGPALLATGIARPQRVVASCDALGVALAGRVHCPDHHAFSQAEVDGWRAWMTERGVQALITTEKDAVRLQEFWPTAGDMTLWVLPIALTWSDDRALDTLLESWTQTLTSSSNRIS
jgi:tetraacyldisaccharide 4'-kinase